MDRGKGNNSFGERYLLIDALGLKSGGRRTMGRLDVPA